MQLVATLGLAVFAAVLVAPAAHAGEMNLNPKYTNGKCQAGIVDADCYHDDNSYTTKTGCTNRIAQIIGVNPKTDYGKVAIMNTSYTCKARPPTGHYLLQVYYSNCPYGLSSQACYKRAHG